MKARNNYQRTRIMTASPAELLVMLYEGLLKRIRTASRAMEQGDWERTGADLGRCQEIIFELIGCLDHDKNPELAQTLAQLYEYCSHRLLTALSSRDLEALDEVYDLLKPLRDAWYQASKQNNSESPPTKSGTTRVMVTG